MDNKNYKISSVYIPKKDYNLSQAIEFLKKHKFKTKKVDESEKYYKFRQLSPQTLKKYGFNDYKAKKLANNIIIILVYKDLEEDDEGGDLNDYNPINFIADKFIQTKNFIINGYMNFSLKVRNILKQVGNDKIKSISIFRSPINYIIKSILEIASLQKIPYDKLFHLGLIFNNNILIEKNSLINMEINPKLPNNTEFLNVNFNLNESITINEFINNGLKFMGNNKFFNYQSGSNNCQDFCLSLLIANKINDNSLNSFIKQDVAYIFSNNPSLRKLSNNITDFDNRVRYITGGKIKKKII